MFRKNFLQERPPLGPRCSAFSNHSFSVPDFAPKSAAKFELFELIGWNYPWKMFFIVMVFSFYSVSSLTACRFWTRAISVFWTFWYLALLKLAHIWYHNDQRNKANLLVCETWRLDAKCVFVYISKSPILPVFSVADLCVSFTSPTSYVGTWCWKCLIFNN